MKLGLASASMRLLISGPQEGSIQFGLATASRDFVSFLSTDVLPLAFTHRRSQGGLVELQLG